MPYDKICLMKIKEYELKLKDLPKEARPREKLIKNGALALRNYELLSIVLGKGSKREEIFRIAKRIADEYGPKSIVNEGDVNKIRAMLDLNEVHACQVVACFELGRRLFAHSQEIYIRNPKDAVGYLGNMRNLKKECLRGLYLDVRNRLIWEETISVGTLTTSVVHSREVFRPAIQYSAVALILVHNHPSGNPSPSSHDLQFTRRMVKVSKIIGIEILDHIIIGQKGYVSLKEKGKI